jgi:hypothetical protein
MEEQKKVANQLLGGLNGESRLVFRSRHWNKSASAFNGESRPMSDHLINNTGIQKQEEETLEKGFECEGLSQAHTSYLW